MNSNDHHSHFSKLILAIGFFCLLSILNTKAETDLEQNTVEENAIVVFECNYP